MPTPRAWSAYAPTYRAPQMRTLAGWIAAGHSGSVVGMGGAGKSNLLGYLAHRPEVLESYLPDDAHALAVLVDLNSLPATDVSTVYRLLLRSFRDARERLDEGLAEEIDALFAEQRAERDPFVVQTALLDWLARLTHDGRHVALVMDRFDRFVDRATPELTDTLRALRDAFKGRLSYLMGMRQPAAYLPDPTLLGELEELLDTRICWVGPMTDADATRMVAEETALSAGQHDPAGLAGPAGSASPADSTGPAGPVDHAHANGPAGDGADGDASAALVSATGGYPALLKAACHWWLDGGRAQPPESWTERLAAQPAIQARLDEVWEGLTQIEQAAMRVLATDGGPGAGSASAAAGSASETSDAVAPSGDHEEAFALLAAKGLVVADAADRYAIRGTLITRHAGRDGRQAAQGRGGLWQDEETGEFRLGGTVLRDLTPLERGALGYLLERPRARISKTELVEGVWPDDVVEDGVMDDALYQVARGLRRKIEPEPGRPHYLITWRGRPEGGYQLFPEGRPG